MSKMQMIFTDFVDRTTVLDALISPEGFAVEVLNQFNENETVEMNAKDLSPSDLSYFLSTLDNATFQFQEDAVIWIVELKGKDIELEKSYVRNATSTERPLAELRMDSVLTARFDVPGFETNLFRELTIRYDNTFDPAELDLLSEIGISIIGNGKAFTIVNLSDCKLSFYKPAIALEKYIINYNAADQIILK